MEDYLTSSSPSTTSTSSVSSRTLTSSLETANSSFISDSTSASSSSPLSNSATPPLLKGLSSLNLSSSNSNTNSPNIQQQQKNHLPKEYLSISQLTLSSACETPPMASSLSVSMTSLSSLKNHVNNHHQLQPNVNSLLSGSNSFSDDGCSTISNSSSTSINSNGGSVLLRIKLPPSHPLITKVLRLPLQATIKECIQKIHQVVTLENHKDCIIVYNQAPLASHHLMSSYFSGNDDSVVPTIEIRESSSTNGKSHHHLGLQRPLLVHSNSVQSLLSGVTKKRNSGNKDSFLFQPPPPSYSKELDKLFWVTSPNHPLKSIPCGNQEDIGLTRKNMRILADILQCNILCYDYTGFGLNSSGKPSLKDLYEDIFIVFNYLTDILKINSRNIILMGKSIGTISTLKFASTLFPKVQQQTSSTNGNSINKRSLKSPIESFKKYKSIGGLILLNSFGPGGISENIVNMLLSLDSFDHLKKLDRIECPVILIHGEDDQVVNVKSSKKLSKLFGVNLFKFVRVKDAGHWNLDTHFQDDYEDDLIGFLKKISPDSFQRKERDAPVGYAMSPNKVVGAFLHRVGLPEYTQAFLQCGYFEMSSIASLDRSMLEYMGVIEQHMGILLAEIEKLSRSYPPSARNSANLDSPNSTTDFSSIQGFNNSSVSSCSCSDTDSDDQNNNNNNNHHNHKSSSNTPQQPQQQ
eukprot:gene1265-1594_t